MKRPPDMKELAKLKVDIATGEAMDAANENGKNPHAVALGRLGGQKGGRARARRLTKRERVSIARAAAAARWKK